MKNTIKPLLQLSIIVLAVSCFVTNTFAIQPLSDSELREASEKLSKNDVGSLDAEHIVELQREGEQKASAIGQKISPPAELTSRQAGLIRGNLTPKMLRDDSLKNHYKDF